jgi:hypothetical protein
MLFKLYNWSYQKPNNQMKWNFSNYLTTIVGYKIFISILANSLFHYCFKIMQQDPWFFNIENFVPLSSPMQQVSQDFYTPHLSTSKIAIVFKK